MGEKPDPMFAKMLQQAIGGIEGEIRGFRGPVKDREMLLKTGKE